MSTLREELESLLVTYNVNADVTLTINIIALFKQQMLGIIGEDEDPKTLMADKNWQVFYRDELRAQLRQEVEKL